MIVNCRICKVDMYKKPETGTIAHWQKHHPKEYLAGVKRTEADLKHGRV